MLKESPINVGLWRRLYQPVEAVGDFYAMLVFVLTKR